MALIYIDGFDTYTTIGEKWGVSNGSPTIGSGTAGRTGNRLNLNGGSLGQRVWRSVTAGATKRVGAAFHFSGLSDGTSGFIRLCEGALTTYHLDLRYNSAGALIVTRNGTVLGTSSAGVITAGAWYYIEFGATIHDSTGAYEVRVSGINVLSASGVDTRNGGTSGTIESVELHTGIDNGGFNIQIDDLWIDSATYHGDCKIETLRPTGAGAHTDFTPSAGSNWQNVDDAAPNDDTDYNASSTVAHQDTFATGDLAAVSGTVKGVQLTSRARKDDAGFRTLRSLIRTSSTDYEGNDHVLSDTYLTFVHLHEVNPNTSSAWTIAQVNAVEIGYTVEA